MNWKPLTILACSGTGAPFIAVTSEIVGYLSAGFVFLAAALLLRRPSPHRWIRIVLFATVLVFHPAWMLDASSGDCGILKLALSAFLAYVFARLLQRRPPMAPSTPTTGNLHQRMDDVD